jgi:hypothetical protein
VKSRPGESCLAASQSRRGVPQKEAVEMEGVGLKLSWIE